MQHVVHFNAWCCWSTRAINKTILHIHNFTSVWSSLQGGTAVQLTRVRIGWCDGQNSGQAHSLILRAELGSAHSFSCNHTLTVQDCAERENLSALVRREQLEHVLACITPPETQRQRARRPLTRSPICLFAREPAAFLRERGRDRAVRAKSARRDRAGVGQQHMRATAPSASDEPLNVPTKPRAARPGTEQLSGCSQRMTFSVTVLF
jgi:hypothetical protein